MAFACRDCRIDVSYGVRPGALHAVMRALPQIAQHAARCNRLQAFREGMSTTFVAILSFSPAAATGTT
ncbi:hypothetical protein XcmpCFBP7700_02565 [Xanthomonas campestris]|nr:hypothetical protein XcmpCFBP7700_02565 [Xanthomonas campestris]